MKKRRGIMVFVFALTMFISSTVFASAGVSLIDNMDPYERDMQIQKLLDERAELLTQDKVNVAALNDIDSKLVELGVEFLSPEEVARQFPQEKAIKDFAMRKKTKISPQVVPPISSVNTWMSYRTSNYYYNGKYYNIQRLIAQPKSTSSPLANLGSRIVSFDYNWSAGAYNVLETAAWSAVGSIPIPGASLAVNFYDAISSFLSGISRTTEVDVPHITYSWSSVTTAVFAYVRLEGQTDDYQWLSYISTKTVTDVGYQIPKFIYENSNGDWVLTPKVVQGKRSITAKPSGYDSILNAVVAYNSSSVPVHAAVGRIRISGPESKIVQYIYPCYPQFPDHCE